MSKNPIRCFEGNAKPYEPFWHLVNAADSESGEPELELYGVLSEYSWYEDEITPQKFKDDLYKLGNGGPITVRIDSPGGDVFAASVIRAIMTDYPGKITTRIDGVAASAAVLVAMTGADVRIQDSAYMMIHDPAVIVFLAQLDIDTLKGLAKDLQVIKRGIVDAYATRTGLSPDKISSMMSAETWMSAADAVENGFADEIIRGGNKKSKPQSVVNLAYVNALDAYEHVPEDLKSNISLIAPIKNGSIAPYTIDLTVTVNDPFVNIPIENELTSQPEESDANELDPAAQELLDEIQLYTTPHIRDGATH